MVLMTRIISFSSGKGGTGKTLVVANLGAAAARLGKRVTIIDADMPMANLGLVLGLERPKVTLHEVLAGEAEISDAIYPGPEGMEIVPSGMSLEMLRKVKLSQMEEVVKVLARGKDAVLIDSPSGLGRDAIFAMKASKETILVITPDIAALSDAFKAKMIAERLGVKPIGVIISRATGKDFDVSEKEIAAMLELPVLAVIPEDSKLRKSATVGEPVVTTEPDSPSAKAFKELTRELFVKKGDKSE